jgi:hypothetical protein
MLNTELVTISRGNRKLGAIMNVSLAPIQCCPKGVPCAKEGCYALKAYRMYPATRIAWSQNGHIARTNPRSYFSRIARAIAESKPSFFRWHVAGDILSTDYLRGMCRIAERNPGTHFLAFTKAVDIVNEYERMRPLPRNLTLIFSAWPGVKIDNPQEHCIAWMQDGTEDRVPSEAIDCPGNCESCAMCFQLPKLRRDVVFHKH